MRFLDANVFIHAFLKIGRTLRAEEKEIKQNAKKIVERIDKGEEVLTSVIHFSEIANFLEDWLPLEEALEIEYGILSKKNIEIIPIAREGYYFAYDLAMEKKIGLNDALAVYIMQKRGLFEIYSFDKDFDRIKSIQRITI
ncbi:MAG: type II toxin-antitoxin system VapC family toxin [Euryarchaeota archaeon]|nr:type II toxin-antitoxin system VapC family toxin [Euryarchaeota archaeon]